MYDWREDLSAATRCHCCNRPGLLRPHVVWFGEAPLQMDRIHRALSCCELFVTIGTSGHVYPAAGFVDAARAAGATTVELNLQASANSHRFDHRVVGPATKITPEFFLPS